MKPLLLACAAAIVGAAAPSHAADLAGHWKLTGKVSSFGFTLDCQFKPEGERLGGVCTDELTTSAKVSAGKSHVLTAGSVRGDKVTWTYRSSFLLSKFDVTYTGVVAGDRMSGTLIAQGHQGSFTGARR